mgnify:CR=1 FL=1
MKKNSTKKYFNMSWSRGHSSLTENPFNKPIVLPMNKKF